MKFSRNYNAVLWNGKNLSDVESFLTTYGEIKSKNFSDVLTISLNTGRNINVPPMHWIAFECVPDSPAFVCSIPTFTKLFMNAEVQFYPRDFVWLIKPFGKYDIGHCGWVTSADDANATVVIDDIDNPVEIPLSHLYKLKLSVTPDGETIHSGYPPGKRNEPPTFDKVFGPENPLLQALTENEAFRERIGAHKHVDPAPDPLIPHGRDCIIEGDWSGRERAGIPYTKPFGTEATELNNMNTNPTSAPLLEQFGCTSASILQANEGIIMDIEQSLEKLIGPLEPMTKEKQDACDPPTNPSAIEKLKRLNLTHSDHTLRLDRIRRTLDTLI